MIILIGLERDWCGSRGSRIIRDHYYVPALLRDGNIVFNIMLKAHSLKELHKSSTNRIATLHLRTYSFLVLLTAHQHHNISASLQHLKLSILRPKEIVRTKIPIKVLRSDKKNQGYTYCVLKNNIEVCCLPLAVPSNIIIKPNQLDFTSKRLRVGQLPLPTGISLSKVEEKKNAVIITALPLRREGAEGDGEKPGAANKKAAPKETAAPTA